MIMPCGNGTSATSTADDIELFLRERLRQRIRTKTKNGYHERGIVKPSTVHQELRVIRRMLNVAVRKKFLPSNPCSSVEFPVALKRMFKPHYVTWSEQQGIERHSPHFLRNIVRIITETGLRINKELLPMRKDQLDIANATVWIPDSKTENGVAEVPLTRIAVDAFRSQLSLAGPGPYCFPALERSANTTNRLRTFGAHHSARRGFRILEFTTSARHTLPGSVPEE
jgi:integrase